MSQETDSLSFEHRNKRRRNMGIQIGVIQGSRLMPKESESSNCLRHSLGQQSKQIIPSCLIKEDRLKRPDS